jgi:2-hydroxychromene-2-carboxylate isomerase
VSKTVDFIFDFASPNAYLAEGPLRDIAARTGATVNRVPCLLGGIFKLTGNSAPFVAFGPIKGKLAYEQLEMQRFIRRHGLTQFRMNPHFPINTIYIMRGLVAAQRLGIGEAYVAVVLKAMWEDGENMGDPMVIARVLGEGGLDSTAILELSQSQPVKDALTANTAASVERGAFGIPTFYVGDEMFFGKERLGQVEEALAG